MILFCALCELALNGHEIELTGINKTIFTLIKPIIEANSERYKNGKKGGRPKKNQIETKTKPNYNQRRIKP